MAGRIPSGHVVIFDDDGFYLGSHMAELVVKSGGTATIVTPEDTVSSWTTNTLEFRHIQKRLYALGVEQITTHNITAAYAGGVTVEHHWSHVARDIPCDTGRETNGSPIELPS